jgi:hypothetical protein
LTLTSSDTGESSNSSHSGSRSNVFQRLSRRSPQRPRGQSGEGLWCGTHTFIQHQHILIHAVADALETASKKSFLAFLDEVGGQNGDKAACVRPGCPRHFSTLSDLQT